MEDVKVLVLTIWAKTIMNSSPHLAIMAAIILLPNVTCKVSKLYVCDFSYVTTKGSARQFGYGI